MRKKKKIILIVIGIVIFLLLVPGLYNYFLLGQKDFGLKYVYYYCDNGVYFTISRFGSAADRTFYTKDGTQLKVCSIWPESDQCRALHETARECRSHYPFSFNFE